MDPETRVEQTMIQELLEEKVTVVGGAGDEVLGELEEGVEEVSSEVVTTGLAEEVGDDEEASASDHLLLDAGAALHQLTDELHQTRAQTGVSAPSCA